MKTWTAWIETRMWCVAHPGKRAAIVTPEGTFILTLERRKPSVEFVVLSDYEIEQQQTA